MGVSIRTDVTVAGNHICLVSSTGIKLALVQAGGTLYLYSDVDTTPSLEDSELSSAVFASGTGIFIGAAIDANDDIHIIWQCNTNNLAASDNSYCVATESAGSWTFGTWQNIAAFTNAVPSGNARVSLALDSSNVPHVVYGDGVTLKGTTNPEIKYTNRIGGTWATPVTLSARVDKADADENCIIQIRNSNLREVIYARTAGSVTNPGDLIYQSYNGTSWSGESTYAETSAFPSGITSTTGGTVYRYHGAGGGNWKQNNASIGTALGTSGKWVSGPFLQSDGDLYFFNITSGGDIYRSENVSGGGWTGVGVIVDEASAIAMLHVFWQYSNLYSQSVVSFVYRVGTTVYYDEVDVDAAPPSFQAAWARGSNVVIGVQQT